MATQDQMRDEEAEFAAAFNEDMGPAPEMSEDEAFGITPPAEDGPATEATAEDADTTAVLVVADGDAMKEEAQSEMAEETADMASAQPGQEDEGPLDPKEEQRRKSWEGRLRAREEELAKREAELMAKMNTKPAEGEGEKEDPQAEAIEKAAEKMAADGDAEGAEAVEEVADKVESGELSAEQAMKILAEDFGPEFVKMIEVIAASKAEAAGRQIAESATSKLSQSVQAIIDDIVDTRAKAHFEAIADKHPDFNDLAQTSEFAQFVQQYPEGVRVAEAGTAKEIIKMLDDFKKSQAPAEPEMPDPAVDAAEGVRSRGIRLPEQPSKAAGYEEAWNDF